MTRRRTLRRLDATEADTLRAIQDWLDLKMAQGRLLYIRHQPPMMTSKRVDGQTKVIFKKVRESQLGAADLIVFQLASGRPDVLCIEMKSAKGKWSEWQMNWSMLARAQGCRYILARSLDDVMEELR